MPAPDMVVMTPTRLVMGSNISDVKVAIVAQALLTPLFTQTERERILAVLPVDLEERVRRAMRV